MYTYKQFSCHVLRLQTSYLLRPNFTRKNRYLGSKHVTAILRPIQTDHCFGREEKEDTDNDTTDEH